MKFRNFKMVGYVVYGRGSFGQLDEIIAPHRVEDKPMVFLLDHFFEGKLQDMRSSLEHWIKKQLEG